MGCSPPPPAAHVLARFARRRQHSSARSTRTTPRALSFLSTPNSGGPGSTSTRTCSATVSCSRTSVQNSDASHSRWSEQPCPRVASSRAATSCGSTACWQASRPVRPSTTEWYYFISIFGTPSADEPWGWQLDGHHLNINCFLLGDDMVLTPTFMGSEPCQVTTGPLAGVEVFAAELQGRPGP